MMIHPMLNQTAMQEIALHAHRPESHPAGLCLLIAPLVSNLTMPSSMPIRSKQNTVSNSIKSIGVIIPHGGRNIKDKRGNDHEYGK